MKPIIRPQDRPRCGHFAPAFGLATILGVGAWLFTAQCHSADSRALGAAVTWDGRGYAVAWADRSGKKKATIYASRYTRSTGEFSPAVRVAVADTLAAGPELSSGASGYLLVLDKGPGGVALEALTRDFRHRAKAQLTPLTDAPRATLCTSPVWSNPVHGVAYGLVEDDAHISYYLAHIREDGQVVRSTRVAIVTGDTPACTLATRDGAFFMAFASQRRSDGATGIMLAEIGERGGIRQITADATEGEPCDPAHDDHGSLAPPMRLTVDESGFRLAYRHAGDGAAHMLRLNRDGDVVADHRMPERVVATTMDMVGDSHGWAMAWSRGKYVEWAAFDDQADERGNWQSPKRPPRSGLRMTTHGSECVAVWTETRGAYVWLLRVRDCLTTGTDGVPGDLQLSNTTARD